MADHSLPSVVPDERFGGLQATEYLINKGHRRIGLINNEIPVPAKFGRHAGYQEALSIHNIPYDESLVYEGSDGVPSGGYDGAMHLMPIQDPPTALFCFNDRMAMGAYDALRKLNLSIPKDVAVIGFDNQDLIAADLYPGLTTMALPHYEMGQWAVRHLLELIQDPDLLSNGQSLQNKLECPIVERASA